MATGIIVKITFVFLILVMITNGEATFYPVKNYGVRANGNSDQSQAIMDAWKKACMSTNPSKVVIPAGKYMVGSMTFKGPCKAPINVHVEGTLQAPANMKLLQSADSWIIFQYIDRLTLSGTGVFDGRGSLTWKQNKCASSGQCSLPVSLRFTSLNNSVVRDITSTDSKLFHMSVVNCINVTLQNININAPGDSLNTDGIHIGRSSGINVINSSIKTGDDCVSIGEGSQQINVERVTCGPGHGISIGSLGKFENEQPVNRVVVRNCTISNTMFGVRIKSWPDSNKGIATDMSFDGIVMNNVGTPILIDQLYCPFGTCKMKVPSRVQLSKVSFKNIRGTSTSAVALKLVCSSGNPCQNVKLSNIDLQYTGKNGTAVSECANVRPAVSGKVFPAACGRSFKV